MSFSRVDSYFTCCNTRCKGWLYLPEGAEKPPVIVMAPGFACEKDFGLQTFAERFVELGMAVFLFDYRNFGESEGEPRNLVSSRRHIQDWEAAIAHVKNLAEVNGNKMALWGVSYSGGHVIKVAVQHPELAAVVALVPFADGRANMKTMSFNDMMKAIGAGMRDVFHELTSQAPYCIPVVAKPGDFGCMNSPGTYEGYLAQVPEGSSWLNKFPARACLTASSYRPITVAKRVKCPVSIIMGEYDTVIYTPSIRAMAAAIHDCKFAALPMGHFNFYQDEELFERVIKLQSEFLTERLLYN